MGSIGLDFQLLFLGGIWYSPKLFGNAWMQDNGLTEKNWNRSNASKIFGGHWFYHWWLRSTWACFWPIHLPNVQVYVLTRPMWAGEQLPVLAGIWVICFVLSMVYLNTNLPGWCGSMGGYGICGAYPHGHHFGLVEVDLAVLVRFV